LARPGVIEGVKTRKISLRSIWFPVSHERDIQCGNGFEQTGRARLGRINVSFATGILLA